MPFARAEPAPSGSGAVQDAAVRGSLPPINMPKAFGGDGGGADGGRRRADEDEAALAERMSPRSIMSDEVRPA